MKLRRDREIRESKVGYRPTQAFLKRLRREHPRIRLAWCGEMEQWLVVQLVPEAYGGVHLVFCCGRIPSEMLIMRKLNYGRIGSLTRAELDRFEAQVDMAAEDASRLIDARASDQFHEGADRLYSALGLETRVSMHGTDRKSARRRRKANRRRS